MPKLKGTMERDVLEVLSKDNREYIIYGFGGNDQIIGGRKGDRLLGGPGWDYLYGKGGDDVLKGGGGNDRLEGGGGYDCLYGGDGDDFVFGGRGDNVLYGENGNDSLLGWDDTDVLYGGRGRDRLSSFGDSLLYGGDGNDLLIASVNDRLYGGKGDDYIYAGQKSIFKLGSGKDRISVSYNTLGNRCSVLDFKPGKDLIILFSQAFDLESKDGLGFSIPDEFAIVSGTKNAKAKKIEAKIIYQPQTGNIFFNANASQSGFGESGGIFLDLSDGLVLSATDFFVEF